MLRRSLGRSEMNNSAASSGVSDRDKTFHGVTPDFLIGGPIPNSSGFPLKACGNDGALAVVENAAR